MSTAMAKRAEFEWKLRTRTVALGRRTLVMGVVNVTPDSFSDGGLYSTMEGAIAHALRLFDEGADIVDVGGESTRPGAKTAQGELSLAGAVTAEEECARVLPVIEGLHKARTGALVSVDTYKAEVARRAVEAGAEVVNDVSGLRWDPQMAATVADLECGVIVMHTRGLPQEWRTLPPEPQIVAIVKRELAERVAMAMGAGVVRERMVLDPGFGFGKNFDENFPLLAHFAEFADLGLPLLAGTSRKSFLGRAAAMRMTELTGEAHQDLAPADRLSGTIASTTIAVMQGAHIVRVHDVKEAVAAVAVADQTRKASE